MAADLVSASFGLFDGPTAAFHPRKDAAPPTSLIGGDCLSKLFIKGRSRSLIGLRCLFIGSDMVNRRLTNAALSHDDFSRRDAE